MSICQILYFCNKFHQQAYINRLYLCNIINSTPSTAIQSPKIKFLTKHSLEWIKNWRSSVITVSTSNKDYSNWSNIWIEKALLTKNDQGTPNKPHWCLHYVFLVSTEIQFTTLFFFVELTYFVHIDGLLYDKPRWVILSTGLKWCSILPNSECIYLPQKTKKDT